MINNSASNLTIKELAPCLGVSRHYVYQMRACGFVMEGVKHSNQTTTVEAALHWIKETQFRLHDGRGVIKSHNCAD